MGQVNIIGDIGVVLEIVAELTNVPVETILGTGRTRLVVAARTLAYWAVRELWTWQQPSWPEIGRALNRDHTTCLMQSRRLALAVLSGDVAAARMCRAVTERFTEFRQTYASLSRYRIGQSLDETPAVSEY
jgi:hypothetical protein